MAGFFNIGKTDLLKDRLFFNVKFLTLDSFL